MSGDLLPSTAPQSDEDFVPKGTAIDLEITELQVRLKDQANLIKFLRERAERLQQPAVNAADVDALHVELGHERELSQSVNQRTSKTLEQHDQLRREKEGYRDQIHVLETSLRQNIDRNHSAVRPIIDVKNAEISPLKDQILNLEREKGAAIEEKANTEKRYLLIRDDFERNSGEIRRRLVELEAEKRGKARVEIDLQGALRDCTRQQAELKSRSHRTQALRDVIAERGARLYQKDREISRLNSG